MAYFKNAENVYKGGILKSLSSMACLIYGGYESETIAPVIAIDLELTCIVNTVFSMKLVA
jgi:hypothetical protein